MHRIDSTGAVDGLWQNGNPTAGLMSTKGDAAWFNAVQEELANIVETTGTELTKGTNTQVRTAIRKHQLGPLMLGPWGFHAHGDYAARMELASSGGRRTLTSNTDTVTVMERELELPPRATITKITFQYSRTGTTADKFLVYLRKLDNVGMETTLYTWDLTGSTGVTDSSGLSIVLDRDVYSYAFVVSMTDAVALALMLRSIKVEYTLT